MMDKSMLQGDSVLGDQLVEAVAARMHRRRLMKRVGLGVAGAAALTTMGVGGSVLSSTQARAQAITDTDILNFALNLEYLEAEYYLRAATGVGLPSSAVTGTGTQGTVTGGSIVPFSIPLLQQYCFELAADEQAHVLYLRETLGNAAVAEPTINIDTAWTNLALAAGLIVSGQTFNPFADEISFFLGAFVFEDVGVTAYLGALGAITTNAYITVAGQIAAVEAYHAGNIRTVLSDIGAGAAVQKISNLRATLSGASDDQGILLPTGNANPFPTDQDALAYTRTTSQVLNIVYFGGSSGGYGFFPNKVNGNITV